MKKSIRYILCLWLCFACSENSTDEEAGILEPNFKFEVSGAINTTMSGNGIVYNEKTIETKNYKGENVKITTLFVIAQDRDSDNLVTFAVTLEGSSVGSGQYQIGTDIFEFYNVFMNFSGDRGETVSYQSEVGSISFDSGLSFLSGSVDVSCPGRRWRSDHHKREFSG